MDSNNNVREKIIISNYVKKFIVMALVFVTVGLSGVFLNEHLNKDSTKNLSQVSVSSLMNKSDLSSLEINNVLKKIKEFGFGEPLSVKQSRLNDFYSVYVDEQVIYLKKDFSYSFYGQLIDNKEKLNITKLDIKIFKTEKEISNILNEEFKIDNFINIKNDHSRAINSAESIQYEKVSKKEVKNNLKEDIPFGDSSYIINDSTLLMEKTRNEKALKKLKELGLDPVEENEFESSALRILNNDDSFDDKNNESTFTKLPEKNNPTKSSLELDAYKQKIKERIESKMSNIIVPGEGSSHKARSTVDETGKESINLSQIQNGKSTVTYKGSTVYKIGYSSTGVKLNADEVREQIKKMYSKVEAAGEKWSVVYPAKGEEKAGVVVFSDPTCPVCKRLHKNIDKLNEAGLTVRILMYPRSLVYGLDDPSTQRTMETLEAIWCSADTAAAMHKVYNGGNISNSDCSYVKEQGRANLPASEHYFLGMLFNIKGTPLSFTSEGSLISGFSTPESFLKRIGVK